VSPAVNTRIVVRGGGCKTKSLFRVRSSFSGPGEPGFRISDIGFRTFLRVREPPK